MAFIDYYKILGVDKTIPQKDVKIRRRQDDTAEGCEESVPEARQAVSSRLAS